MAEKTVTSETMQEIYTKLEDLYNSQAALNQKLAVIQLALEDAPNDKLSKQLDAAFGHAQENAGIIKQAAHTYELEMNARRMEEH